MASRLKFRKSVPTDFPPPFTLALGMPSRHSQKILSSSFLLGRPRLGAGLSSVAAFLLRSFMWRPSLPRIAVSPYFGVPLAPASTLRPRFVVESILHITATYGSIKTIFCAKKLFLGEGHTPSSWGWRILKGKNACVPSEPGLDRDLFLCRDCSGFNVPEKRAGGSRDSDSKVGEPEERKKGAQKPVPPFWGSPACAVGPSS